MFIATPSIRVTGELTSHTSPHSPRNATVPRVRRSSDEFAYDAISACSGMAATKSLNVCVAPGSTAEVMSTSPPGKSISPT